MSAPRERVAIVTGGGRGIGFAAAKALAADGCAVCVNDTGVTVDGAAPDADVAERAAADIRCGGGRALAVAADARTAAAARALVQTVTEWAGATPNIVVHAAGTLRDGMLHRTSDDDWQEVVGSHLSVAVEVTRAVAGDVRSQGFGRFVYVGGAAGLVGNVGQGAYVVAKAALIGLMRAVALEMRGRDVSANYVAPFAYTRMTETIPPVTPQLAAYLESAPLATPDDVAPLIAWLSSRSAAGVSGQVFGARGAEVTLWSQPAPAVAVVERSGWTAALLEERARPRFAEHFASLASEFDLFGGPPTPVLAKER